MNTTEELLACIRHWQMHPAPQGYAQRIHIAFDYRRFRAQHGKPSPRQADAQARCLAALMAAEYGISLAPAHIRQMSGELLLHQLIYPLPLLGRASNVIDLDVYADAQARGMTHDPRNIINVCARAVYRLTHIGRQKK